MDKISSISEEKLCSMIKDCVEKRGVFPLTVTGSSMCPTLSPLRDMVWLVSPGIRPPAKGELLLFLRTDGSLVLHRLVRIQKDGTYLMNGDGQSWTETTTADRVLAVVREIERKGRRFSVDNRKYRWYVRLWGVARPFRPALVRIKAWAGRKKRT